MLENIHAVQGRLIRMIAGITIAGAVTTAQATAALPASVLLHGHSLVLQAGDPSLRRWLVPNQIPAPPENSMTPERVRLGEMLFFDARLSIHGFTSCVMCHLPERGFADGVPASVRFMGERMTRNSPGLMNVAFNRLQMWDGRNATLEQQALNSQNESGSLGAGARELGVTGLDLGIQRIRQLSGYVDAFARAYPGEPITRETAAKAIAAFERSLVSRDSPFDRWVRGDARAMSARQVRGFRVFVDSNKGDCAACHAGPTFTDNAFHNIGLSQYGRQDADVGRYAEQPLATMRGAFRTPTLRDVALTAPYFHDGSAPTLRDVVEHYAGGGVVRTNLSPLMHPLPLTDEDKSDLVEFLKALTTQRPVYDPPRLPR
jgi:cytochrome c peroxidase